MSYQQLVHHRLDMLHLELRAKLRKDPIMAEHALLGASANADAWEVFMREDCTNTEIGREFGAVWNNYLEHEHLYIAAKFAKPKQSVPPKVMQAFSRAGQQLCEFWARHSRQKIRSWQTVWRAHWQAVVNLVNHTAQTQKLDLKEENRVKKQSQPWVKKLETLQHTCRN